MTTTVERRHDPAPTERAETGLLNAAAVFIGRSLRHAARDVEALLMVIMLPVMLMVLFTFVFGGAIETGQSSYIQYVTPGIILLCTGFGASTTAVAVAEDLKNGVIDRFRSMPIPAAAVLIGHVVASLVRNLIATAVVILVGLAVGFRPHASLLGWVGAVAVIAAWVLAMTALFAFLGLVSSSPQAASGYGFALLFLPYVSSAFVPVSSMPSWLHGFAEHQPVTPVIETVRALLEGGSPGGTVWVALAWCLGIAAVSASLVAVIFPRR